MIDRTLAFIPLAIGFGAIIALGLISVLAAIIADFGRMLLWVLRSALQIRRRDRALFRRRALGLSRHPRPKDQADV